MTIHVGFVKVDYRGDSVFMHVTQFIVTNNFRVKARRNKDQLSYY